MSVTGIDKCRDQFQTVTVSILLWLSRFITKTGAAFPIET